MMAEEFTQDELDDEEKLRNDDFDPDEIEKELELLEDELDMEKKDFLKLNKKESH